jgi:hypothetical protein
MGIWNVILRRRALQFSGDAFTARSLSFQENIMPALPVWIVMRCDETTVAVSAPPSRVLAPVA